ncbi:type I-C CRISPR-associated endonuclease Cas1c [Kurthia sibirica]|uniref:CRISPR-associated endonuclease Cas1 n=1 Tax=Kurthia sibirica TaxID=202750 RepID=A0A2U3API7_9BACL|nr:type I-C CRISPR-associated endonuclease Cas1c [Kurthia sibirica]PWI26429.1 subtype I-C CRISPR-associated endonuclease Cas1 [Kurthia sibirica]GEK32993.1 CRISPR-associated endonuclease Cas1 [Kurthia sibirica]
MRKLLNTLFITQENTYLTLKGETVVILVEQEKIGQIPLLNLEGICTFGYAGASPKLMAYCAEKDINLTFFTPTGRFLARVTGKSQGNVLLRKVQYRISDDELESTKIAKNMIFGKISNQRWQLERAIRDHPMRIDHMKFKKTSLYLKLVLENILQCNNLESLRGYEGQAASMYFSCFNDLLLQQDDDFAFTTRSRRPPLDRINALLSFSYSLLSSEVGAALENVGLDAYVGFLHRDRPGRMSLALDMMEELRPLLADRFVISLINRKEIKANDFLIKENGAVSLTEEARKIFLKKWQQKKMESLTHPRLKEKINWGLVPHAQALLLARHLRGDSEEYPPFLWK